MVKISLDYISVGGNRHPAAADWDRSPSGVVAFGADNNIALWDPLCFDHRGIFALLSGHEDAVNVVKFFSVPQIPEPLILSGSVDKTVRIWQRDRDDYTKYVEISKLTDHPSSINCIALLPGTNIFVTGAADASLKIWKIANASETSDLDVQLIQSITLTPKFFPLSVALAALDDRSVLLAVAGTKSTIQLYLSRNDTFSLVATLAGHEGWIRSLSITRESGDEPGDLLLASASQDKYIRLWRVHQGLELPASSRAASDPALGVLGKSLSNKAHRFESNGNKYSVTFEALLLGHEDWIYSVAWHRRNNKLQLLSASADNSLAIWEADENSGIWISIARLGEISAQKGSTTATGSTGGFWTGLWSPTASAVVSLGRTGSWRLWTQDDSSDQWTQGIAVTGHVKEVKGITWSRSGAYLLSASNDQTTRLHAKWEKTDGSSWHEFSRPQIHGYNLNCIDTLTENQFISGADEKLLRVFDEPEAVAEILRHFCGIKKAENLVMPDAANIPVLGLSNKAIQAVDDEEVPTSDPDCSDAPDPASIIHKSALKLRQPPFEDHLSRLLLWPEREKLYGHGYEISTVATSHDGKLVATACRASSVDHAVIRLYETEEWREIKPPLKNHSLTVTGLQFSPDDQYLLSVGRDRQWALFEGDANGSHGYKLVHSDPKGHSRMILSASWAPLGTGRVFATAGRDKAVKLWRVEDGSVVFVQTITAPTPVTAVAFLPQIVGNGTVLAYGLENGSISVCVLEVKNLQIRQQVEIEKRLLPSKGINQLSWRPKTDVGPSETVNGTTTSSEGHLVLHELAIASDDTSLRLYSIKDLFES